MSREKIPACRRNLMRFGKYKDQDISVLKRDPSYVEWLLSQKWFGGLIRDAIEDETYHISHERWMEVYPTKAYLRRKARERVEAEEIEKWVKEMWGDTEWV